MSIDAANKELHKVIVRILDDYRFLHIVASDTIASLILDQVALEIERKKRK